MAQNITDANFAEIIGGDKPVLVDFWATWCGPCRKIAPFIENLAEKYEGKAIVAKCDIGQDDECSEIVMKYGIRSIPTLLFFKAGELVDRHTGGDIDENGIAAKIDALL